MNPRTSDVNLKANAHPKFLQLDSGLPSPSFGGLLGPPRESVSSMSYGPLSVAGQNRDIVDFNSLNMQGGMGGAISPGMEAAMQNAQNTVQQVKHVCA